LIKLYVGYDPREAAVYHTFCQSVIENTSTPVSFIPLHKDMLNNFDGQQDGTNAFIYSRYLIPYLEGWDGWAIFCDGDMHANADMAELWALRDKSKAVQVVKHDYQTKHARKYIGTPIENDNIDYPRKNWSSVTLWNCAHPRHKYLIPENVANVGGKYLHRFEWLNDEDIGELPIEWNWLEGEYNPNPSAKLVHQTLGSPGFTQYAETPSSRDWNGYLLNALHMEGERQHEMVRRAHWHCNKLQQAS
jgi:lipopolysaccharide biosynthesis glycosyltransferase